MKNPATHDFGIENGTPGVDGSKEESRALKVDLVIVHLHASLHGKYFRAKGGSTSKRGCERKTADVSRRAVVQGAGHPPWIRSPHADRARRHRSRCVVLPVLLGCVVRTPSRLGWSAPRPGPAPALFLAGSDGRGQSPPDSFVTRDRQVEDGTMSWQQRGERVASFSSAGFRFWRRCEKMGRRRLRKFFSCLPKGERIFFYPMCFSSKCSVLF